MATKSYLLGEPNFTTMRYPASPAVTSHVPQLVKTEPLGTSVTQEEFGNCWQRSMSLVKGPGSFWGLLLLCAYLQGNTPLQAETKVSKTSSTSKETLPPPQISSIRNTVPKRRQKNKILTSGNKISSYLFLGNR